MKPLILIFLLALFVVTVNGSCPSPGQLSCDDGKECINSSNWCDKHEDCADKSDELYCNKKSRWSWQSGKDPNDCENTHYLCDDGRCVPQSAECNGHSDCKDGSDEDYCEKSEEQTEEPKSSTEETEKSSEETKKSSEETKKSSEETKKSSEESKTSSEESSEEVKPSSKENKSDKEDVEDTLTQHNNDYDDETPNLSTTKSTPSTTTVVSRFFIEEIPMTPIANGYYDKKLNGFTTPAPRTYIPTSPRPHSFSAPTFSSEGKYYPPPAPTYPRNTLNYPSHSIPTQSTPNINRQPTNPLGRSGRPSYDTGSRRQHTVQDPSGSRRQSTHSAPEIRGQPTRYSPDDYRQPTNYNSDRSRQSSYNTPNGRGQQPTYHLPTSRHNPYNHFHQNVIPPTHYVSPAPHVPSYTGHRKILPRFDFLRNFSTARNDESVSRAVDWILSRKEPYRGWGKDTPRAIVALSLANNSFNEGDISKTYLNLQVGLKLLNPQDLRETELAHFVLALLATCQDPSDFQGVDLGRTLLERRRTQNPFTLLTACLAGQPLGNYLNDLIYNFNTPYTEKQKDRLILSLSAFSCYLWSNPSEQTRLAETLHNATSKLLRLKLDNGSFGSVYSTAIAAQALMSLNNTLGWNPDSTFSFLRERQNVNGSFGDFLATYYVIPSLRGRSLLHLRNIHCTPKNEELTPQEILEYQGTKQYLKYSLHFGYPLSNAYSVLMHVPVGINFFDVMRVAEYQNKHFNFQYDKSEEKIKVYSISDVPNDTERALAWHLYVKRDHYSNFQKRNPAEDVRKLFPQPNEHYVFWYHHIGLDLGLTNS